LWTSEASGVLRKPPCVSFHVVLGRLRRRFRKRDGRKVSLAEDDAVRRQAERELRDAERRMAEERQRLESGGMGGPF
jgi:hypothetical protein